MASVVQIGGVKHFTQAPTPGKEYGMQVKSTGKICAITQTREQAEYEVWIMHEIRRVHGRPAYAKDAFLVVERDVSDWRIASS